jgi:hypothetical protein
MDSDIEEFFNKFPSLEKSKERIVKHLTVGVFPCENKCGRLLTATTFSVFVLPEEKNHEVLFVCSHCVQQLYMEYNYGNKN